MGTGHAEPTLGFAFSPTIISPQHFRSMVVKEQMDWDQGTGDRCTVNTRLGFLGTWT